jgi:acetolactate synthase-1/2/3 large subunit
MAKRFQTPFLQVVDNNGGWLAPRLSTPAVYPAGYAARANDLDLSFEPSPNDGGIAAAAGGAPAIKIEWADEAEAAIARAVKAAGDEKLCAVVDARLADA